MMNVGKVGFNLPKNEMGNHVKCIVSCLGVDIIASAMRQPLKGQGSEAKRKYTQCVYI